MRYVEATEEWNEPGHGLFIAGGITGCPDWQQEFCSLLIQRSVPAHFSAVVLNPRRKDFPIGDPDAAWEQIAWEYRHLQKADAISFWFAKETIQPIVLFELGSWLKSDKPIFVGVHPEYPRKQDVEIQVELARPGTIVVSTLRDLAEAVSAWAADPDPRCTAVHRDPNGHEYRCTLKRDHEPFRPNGKHKAKLIATIAFPSTPGKVSR